MTQLYDPAIEVCEIAVMYLEEACTDPVNLEKVVYLCPSLEHLGDIGANLFLRCVILPGAANVQVHVHIRWLPVPPGGTVH